MKNYIAFVFLGLCLFLKAQTQPTDYTEAEIDVIRLASSASEGSLYHDYENDIYYLGVTNGELTTLGSTTENLVSSATIWVDASTVTVPSTAWNTVKSFTVPGGSLSTNNAIRIVCYRRNISGSARFRLYYGGDYLFASGNLSTPSARDEFIIYGAGTTNSQKAFMDDANTGNNGQRYGEATTNSTLDQNIDIQMRRNGGGDNLRLEFCSAELLKISN